MTDSAARIFTWTWLIGFLYVLVLFFNPPNDPPSAPAGCGLINGAPVHVEDPLSYEDRFSVGAVGPSHGVNCQCLDCYPYNDHCPVSRAAVTAQGVGE